MGNLLSHIFYINFHKITYYNRKKTQHRRCYHNEYPYLPAEFQVKPLLEWKAFTGTQTSYIKHRQHISHLLPQKC